MHTQRHAHTHVHTVAHSTTLPPPTPSFPPNPIYLLQCLIQNYWVRWTFQRTVWLWGKHFYKVCTVCADLGYFLLDRLLPTSSVRTCLAMESTPCKNRSCGLGACLCRYTQQHFPAPWFLSNPKREVTDGCHTHDKGHHPWGLTHYHTTWHASNPRRIKSTKVRSLVFNFRIKSTKLISPNESESNKLTHDNMKQMNSWLMLCWTYSTISQLQGGVGVKVGWGWGAFLDLFYLYSLVHFSPI